MRDIQLINQNNSFFPHITNAWGPNDYGGCPISYYLFCYYLLFSPFFPSIITKENFL